MAIMPMQDKSGEDNFKLQESLLATTRRLRNRPLRQAIYRTVKASVKENHDEVYVWFYWLQASKGLGFEINRCLDVMVT